MHTVTNQVVPVLTVVEVALSYAEIARRIAEVGRGPLSSSGLGA
jgi:hypothetical protein